MSTAEIADNKWEVSATKPPIGSAGGIAQILVMGGFAVFFVWIVIASVIAIVTPKGEGLAGEYEKMKQQDAAAAPGGEAAKSE